MRTALKWYLIIGLSVLFILWVLDFITPAISEDALILSHVWVYFNKFFSLESFMIAAVGVALLDRGGAKK